MDPSRPPRQRCADGLSRDYTSRAAAGAASQLAFSPPRRRSADGPSRGYTYASRAAIGRRLSLAPSRRPRRRRADRPRVGGGFWRFWRIV